MLGSFWQQKNVILKLLNILSLLELPHIYLHTSVNINYFPLIGTVDSPNFEGNEDFSSKSSKTQHNHWCFLQHAYTTIFGSNILRNSNKLPDIEWLSIILQLQLNFVKLTFQLYRLEKRFWIRYHVFSFILIFKLKSAVTS